MSRRHAARAGSRGAEVGELVLARPEWVPGVTLSTLEQAIELLSNARHIEFYGLGNSGIVAADAQHRFYRLGIPAVAYSDPHVYAMAATLLQPRDVAVVFSSSGRSLDLLASVELALDAGAAVIAVTALASPLASRATVALEIVVDADTGIYTPMTTRIARLTLVDLLSVGVALRQGPELAARLARATDSLASRQVRGFD